MENKKVSIVITAKNEEKTVVDIIEGVRPFADQIIVVDGNSHDRTRELALSVAGKISLISDKGNGKGAAIRRSLKEVIADLIVFIDADGSHKAEEIPALIDPILSGKASMVIGSRILGYSDEYYGNLSERLRLFGNKLITKIINIIWRADLTDSQNGFRAISKEVIDQLELKEDSFAIEQEMVIRCLKLKKKIAEVPSHELRRKYGRSNVVPFVMVPRYILCLLKEILF